MIPDKIYLCSEGDYFLSEKWDTEPSKGLTNNEYIRKEALNKMLDDAITDLSDGSLTGYYQSLAYQDIKDKINSM